MLSFVLKMVVFFVKSRETVHVFWNVWVHPIKIRNPRLQSQDFPRKKYTSKLSPWGKQLTGFCLFLFLVRRVTEWTSGWTEAALWATQMSWHPSPEWKSSPSAAWLPGLLTWEMTSQWVTSLLCTFGWKRRKGDTCMRRETAVFWGFFLPVWFRQTRAACLSLIFPTKTNFVFSTRKETFCTTTCLSISEEDTAPRLVLSRRRSAELTWCTRAQVGQWTYFCASHMNSREQAQFVVTFFMFVPK